MDDPRGTARLDHSLTPPGEKTRPSAAPPAAALTAVKQEIGAEHETVISLENGHGGEVSISNTQRVATGGAERGGGTIERETSPDPESATPDKTPTTDEEEEEDSGSSTESAAAAAMTNKKRRTSNSSVNSTRTKCTTSLNDTHPSGYNPTPFYYTLVKALTGKRKRS